MPSFLVGRESGGTNISSNKMRVWRGGGVGGETVVPNMLHASCGWCMAFQSRSGGVRQSGCIRPVGASSSTLSVYRIGADNLCAGRRRELLAILSKRNHCGVWTKGLEKRGGGGRGIAFNGGSVLVA